MSKEQLWSWGCVGTGVFMLLFGAGEVVTGKAWASTGNSQVVARITGGPRSFAVAKKDDPDLYWYNIKVHAGLGVVLLGIGGYMVVAEGKAGKGTPAPRPAR
jgi:hypothetical protein